MGKVWAIARHTSQEAVRSRIVHAAAFVIIALVALLPFVIQRPNATYDAMLQTFLTWALVPQGVLLAFLTIILACQSIWEELYGKQLHVLMTKPLPRWQYVIGKWLGVQLVTSALLLFGAVLTYSFALYLASLANGYDIVRLQDAGDREFVELSYMIGESNDVETQAELIVYEPPKRMSVKEEGFHELKNPTVVRYKQSTADKDLRNHLNSYVKVYKYPVQKRRIQNEILTARGRAKQDLPPFAEMAERRYQRLVEEGVVDRSLMKDKREIKSRTVNGLAQRYRTLRPEEVRVYEFSGLDMVDRTSNIPLQLKYKAKGLRYAADETLLSEWRFGDPQKTLISSPMRRRDVMENFHTIEFPPACVAPDGTLMVAVRNMEHVRRSGRAATIVFDGQDGMEVLFKISSFESNFVRMLFLVWCRLALLGAFAIMMATCLSFPVACLAACCFYIMAISSDFVKDAMDFGAPGKGALGKADVVVEPLLNGLFFFWPRFGDFNGIPEFVDGMNVSLMWNMRAAGELIVIMAIPILLGACIIFRYRQVAKLSI